MSKDWCLRIAVFLLIVQFVAWMPTVSMASEKIGIATANVIIRTQPSKDSEGQRTVKQGDTMTILDTSISGWYKVQHGVVIGYVSKDYVKIQSASSASSSATSSSSSSAAAASESLPSSISELGSAPSPTSEGDKGKDVTKLQKALKILGYYSGTCDGVYGNNTISAVKAFQKSRGLSQDGIAGKSTIKYLFGSGSDSTYQTEKLDWFNGGATIIPKGATITIKDVATGSTFTVKRWSGYNHLDAEPASAKDTAIMKEIYGGSWSWSRRAILVLYNGHVYAASMNGYPHGEKTISGNNFTGHICIHFYNSRTHQTDRVDEAHQAAVATAMKASWD